MTQAILSVRVSAVSAAGAGRRAVGGFLRYLQHRDHHFDREQVRDVDGLVRYVAYRDAASPEGRLFDRAGTVGRDHRLELTGHVARSLEGVKPRWVRGRDGKVRDQAVALYRFVISPADARGLDLRQLTRETMAELEARVGLGAMPPWIAAEHRNTDHPHVHVVMAGRREVGRGSYRELHLTRERLAAMKTAMVAELERQREGRARVHGSDHHALARLSSQRGDATGGRPPVQLGKCKAARSKRDRSSLDVLAFTGVTKTSRVRSHEQAWARRTPARAKVRLGRSVSGLLGSMAAHHRREMELAVEQRLERSREEDQRHEREGQR
jgi:hypothetical protein